MKKLTTLVLLFVFTQMFAQQSLKVELKDSSQLKLTSLKINVAIVGNFAKTTYDMKFYNELDRTLEGELVFPLAEGQAVSQFAMDVNGKLRDAVIVEKELARVAYESTIRQRIDPGLLEKTEGNNYKARVYPILPRKYKHIVLTFEQELSVQDQLLTYVLPLGLEAELEDFSIHIQVYSGEGMPEVKSSDYKNFVFQERDDVFTANIKRKDHTPGSPVVVELPYSTNTTNVLSYRDYFYINHKLEPKKRLKQKPEKITLLWDTSYSLKNRNLDKEIAVLNTYFDYIGNAEVHFIAFSNAIHKNSVFTVRNGSWEGLKKVLRETDYDGGTSLNLFNSLPKQSDEILLFTDGLANLGDFSTTNNQAIYTINSTTSANHELLNTIATSSGGNYVNLIRLPETKALEVLQQETFQFLGAVHDSNVQEVFPKNNTNISEDFSISGRFARASTIELLFGYQGIVTERVEVPLTKTRESELVRRIWAKQKLKHLNIDKEINKEQIISLAKSYHLITDYTSMLILDRIQDYVRYRIEPPQELRAQYKERVRILEQQQADDFEYIKDRKMELYDDFETILDWYDMDYPKKKNKQNKNVSRNSQTPNPVTNQSIQNTRSVSQVIDSGNNAQIRARMTRNIDSTRGIVSGTVLDGDNLPLPGANVVVKGTTNGTQTDFDGNFVINAEEGDELVVNYIGFSTSNTTVGDSNTVAIKLEEDAAALDEVVVTGMGVQTERRAMGYAVSSVVSQSLQGRVAGVQITENEGATGAGINVTIRGSSSVSADNNPLFVVDGIPAKRGSFPELNPQDIKGIEVIKGMSASALYGSRGANGVVLITTKNGMEEQSEAIEALNEMIAEKIELKPRDPETPYINVLQKEPNIEMAYKKYLEIRDKHSNSPTFYLDVSDFFDQKGRSDIAITIITNLIEIELNNHELMKALGYKLEYFKQFDLAVMVFKKVLELRPEEPQSYRDLALAYEQAGKIKESYNMLSSIYNGDLLEKDEDERYYGIEHIAYVELSRLVNKYPKELSLSMEDRKKFRAIPVDVRVVIDWNHNDTDIDLWVEDPSGEKASYSNVETRIGGRMSEDMTEGYGPEEFMLKKAPKGTYTISVDYFADSVQKISGPTILKVTLFKNYGRSNESKQTIVVRLDEEEDILEVGRLVF